MRRAHIDTHCPRRTVRIGPVRIWQLARSFGIRTPGWSLVAIPTLAWLRRGWWCWQWVGWCLIVRGGPFVLTVWRPVPDAIARERQRIFSVRAGRTLPGSAGAHHDAGEQQRASKSNGNGAAVGSGQRLLSEA